MKPKKLTIANLNRDYACSPGMDWITPLIKAKDPEIVSKLFAHSPAWWGWAAGRGYDVWDGIDLWPQTREIRALVERYLKLTPSESMSLVTAGDAARNAAWIAARNAAWIAARVAARDAVWIAAGDAVWIAAGDAAVALVVRDLIGSHGFTQAHYDTLTRPWRTVIGKLHPDDEELREKGEK